MVEVVYFVEALFFVFLGIAVELTASESVELDSSCGRFVY